MQEPDDIALLRQYVERNSEEAFAVLVERHLNKVYSVALRHTHNPHQAQDISQAVFIILARESRRLGKRVMLSGWLYQAARLTAVTFVRSDIRRARREQEALMQTESEENASDAWRQVAPLLDAAMAGLNEADRQAVVLRFFDGKSLGEVAVALGVKEEAAKKRVSRALEKLRVFFARRGFSSTTALIAGAISANSVQAAPLGLAASVTAAAMKGTAVTATTLSLVTGALKVMTWTKTQLTVGVAFAALLLVGTTTVAVHEIQEHRTYSWEVSKMDYPPVDGSTFLANTPPQVRIVRSKYSHYVGWLAQDYGTEWVNGKLIIHPNEPQSIGIGVPASLIVKTAYGSDDLRTIFEAPMPKGLYDYIANPPHGGAQALQKEIKRRFGVVGIRKMIERKVLALQLARPDARALKPTTGSGNTLAGLTGQLEADWGWTLPVINNTGLTNRYDFSFTRPELDTSTQTGKQAIRDALYDQLGLELVETNMPIKMLVVQRPDK